MADDVFSIGRKLDSIIKAKDFNEDNVTDLLKALQSLPMSLEMLQVQYGDLLYKFDNCIMHVCLLREILLKIWQRDKQNCFYITVQMLQK